MKQQSRPELTAAVVVGEQRERAERCLACLLRQTALDSIEILALDISAERADLRGAEHRSVRYIHRPDIAYFATAMRECVRQAQAPVIALIEDHCYADPNWAASIIEAFHRPVQIVNYSFTGTGREGYIGRSLLFVEYGRWMVPATGGPIALASSSNISYRREALKPYWDRLDEWFEVEFLLHRQIQRRGGTIWWEPGAVVAHEEWATFSDGCRANGVMKRMLAARRAVHGGWGRGRRFFYAAAMTLAPPLHLWRLARSVGNRPSLWPLLFTSLPVSLGVFVHSSYHEALGYLFGAGASREQFRALELSLAREV